MASVVTRDVSAHGVQRSERQVVRPFRCIGSSTSRWIAPSEAVWTCRRHFADPRCCRRFSGFCPVSNDTGAPNSIRASPDGQLIASIQHPADRMAVRRRRDENRVSSTFCCAVLLAARNPGTHVRSGMTPLMRIQPWDARRVRRFDRTCFERQAHTLGDLQPLPRPLPSGAIASARATSPRSPRSGARGPPESHYRRRVGDPHGWRYRLHTSRRRPSSRGGRHITRAMSQSGDAHQPRLARLYPNPFSSPRCDCSPQTLAASEELR